MIRYLKQYKFLLFLTALFTAISSLSYVFIAILLQQVYLLPLLQVIQYTIIFIASLAVMIYFDIIVTVCVIIAIAIMLVVPSLFGGLLSKRQDKYSDMLSDFTNHVKDLLSGFEDIVVR